MDNPSCPAHAPKAAKALFHSSPCGLDGILKQSLVTQAVSTAILETEAEEGSQVQGPLMLVCVLKPAQATQQDSVSNF